MKKIGRLLDRSDAAKDRLAPEIAALRKEVAAMRAIRAAEYRERMFETPRYREENRVVRHGYRAYSQNDEDGIIEEIFRRIGATARTFFEIGVETGIECNTLNLLAHGWRGTWVEKRPSSVGAIKRDFKSYLDRGRLRIEESLATPANIDALIANAGFRDECDLLSIDIDINDYWVWRAISQCRPRAVVIEYNAVWRPPLAVTLPEMPDHSWDGSNYHGASLKALEELGVEKGYRLVGCCFAGVNAFFVRSDLCGDKFAAPFSAENHYEPFRPFMVGQPAGHRHAFGELVSPHGGK